MAHEPDHPIAGSAERLLGRHAEPAHAGLDLQVHGKPGNGARLVHGHFEPSLTRALTVSVAERAHSEDARPAGNEWPERHSLPDGRHAETCGAGFDRDRRDVRRAVAVRVRLDDSPELGGRDGLAESLDVARERAEIDGDLGSAHRAEL